MTRLRILGLFVLTAFLLSIANLGATKTTAQHGFSIKEYEKFHDVLHPLEHDALPKKDYRRIRSQANLLVKRGNAIVKLGVPSGTSEDKKEEFAKELDSFRKALATFKKDARTGTNSRLKTSYSAVHDSFEMVAALLPRR
jgi:DNA-binding transcriptional MerR regulator